MTQVAWRNRITGHGEEAPDQLLANPYVVKWMREYPQQAAQFAQALLGLQRGQAARSVRVSVWQVLPRMPRQRSGQVDEVAASRCSLSRRPRKDARTESPVERGERSALSVAAEGLPTSASGAHLPRCAGALRRRVRLLRRDGAVLSHARPHRRQGLGAPTTGRQHRYVEVGARERLSVDLPGALPELQRWPLPQRRGVPA